MAISEGLKGTVSLLNVVQQRIIQLQYKASDEQKASLDEMLKLLEEVEDIANDEIDQELHPESEAV